MPETHQQDTRKLSHEPREWSLKPNVTMAERSRFAELIALAGAGDCQRQPLRELTAPLLLLSAGTPESNDALRSAAQ
jgi:hypothetical protein